MEERPYGSTGEKFPILSFGAMHIVDSSGCPEAEAIKIVNYALDRGIRYFDTAYWYADGQSEERLELFKEILPSVTPAGMPWKAEDWDNPMEWRRRE